MLLGLTPSIFWITAIVKIGVPGVWAKTCYYGQEPDPSHGGKLRWTVPPAGDDGGDLCSCISLQPGALNVATLTTNRLAKPTYTDRPVFTDDRQEIQDLFDCPAEGSIRLIDRDGHPNSIKGRVEVYYNREWGTVCNDMFGKKDLAVTCRQLGYSYDNVRDPSMKLLGGLWRARSGPIHLDNLACFGNETRLAACPHKGWGLHNCEHNQDVAIRCAVS